MIQWNLLIVNGWGTGTASLFNAFCDGKDISPMGGMVRPSGCPISACPISSDKREYAEVEWKSDKELLELMSDIIKPYLDLLPQESRELFDGNNHFSFNQPVVNLFNRQFIN